MKKLLIVVALACSLMSCTIRGTVSKAEYVPAHIETVSKVVGKLIVYDKVERPESWVITVNTSKDVSFTFTSHTEYQVGDEYPHN
jgi:hypothetical protein